MLCRLQEADRLAYGALAFQGGKVGKLQRHAHAVLLRGVHPGHQLQVFQHIERECLMDCARVDGHETADTLHDSLLLFAFEIIRERPFLYLLLSCCPLCLRCRAVAGVCRFCRVISGIGITITHPVLYGLQCPFSDAAFLDCAFHGEMFVPVLLCAEAVLYGHFDNLANDNGTAHPLGIPRLGMSRLPANHVHHCLETLAVIQPAQYKWSR